MEARLVEIADRIRTLRDVLDISMEEMARRCGMTAQQYRTMEEGSSDFSFSFLLKVADVLGVDMIELITGEDTRLSFYSVVRKGKGLSIKRNKGFTYQHLAYLFRGKECEPFLVTAPYSEEQQSLPIDLSVHKGQEFDYILSGSLKVVFEGGREEVLEAGDCVYYDSSHGHGMIAVGGQDCSFLAVVLKEE